MIKTFEIVKAYLLRAKVNIGIAFGAVILVIAINFLLEGQLFSYTSFGLTSVKNTGLFALLSICLLLLNATNRELDIYKIVMSLANLYLLYGGYWGVNCIGIIIPLSLVIFNLTIYKVYTIITRDNSIFYKTVLLATVITLKNMFILFYGININSEFIFICSIVNYNEDLLYCELKSKSANCIATIRAKHGDFVQGNISWDNLSKERQNHLLFWYDRLVKSEKACVSRAIELGHLGREYNPTNAQNFINQIKDRFPNV